MSPAFLLRLWWATWQSCLCSSFCSLDVSRFLNPFVLGLICRLNEVFAVCSDVTDTGDVMVGGKGEVDKWQALLSLYAL
jgi:hypothetical protein